jgi:hypothetical protein
VSTSRNQQLEEFKELLQKAQTGPAPASPVRVLRFITTMAKTNAAGFIDSQPVLQVVYTLDAGGKARSYTEYLPLDSANDDVMSGSALWPTVKPMLEAKGAERRAELVHRSGSF